MGPIFLYNDYRIYLRELYRHKKRQSRYFSYRLIAQRLGKKSSGLFGLIITGKMNISAEMASSLAAAFKLQEKERDYFILLVHYNQSKEPEEKQHWLEKMHCFVGANAIKVNSMQSRFYEKWYYNAIWAIIGYCDFKGDYKKLAHCLYPPISPDEARMAVELLLELRLIRKLKNGRFHQIERLLSSGSDVDRVAVNEFQLKMMDLASHSMYRVPRDMREFSTLTLGLPVNGFELIKNEVQKCRQKLLGIIKGLAAESVYQVNFQIFPLTTLEIFEN